MNPPRMIIARAYPAYSVMAGIAFALTPHAALALGSVDPTQAVTNIGQWLFLLLAALIPLIFAYKGVHAMMNGERFGIYVAGLIGGLALVVGGYTIMTKMTGA